ncbi:hypothetical protein Vretimale_5055 [Volvox reticuliferus]|uniref:Uncharacterized protein n=1 Tax=Volvox reticuliferus TaxID=1737510 RepID=A0A8J4DDD8_9CHLO|nr:hypothetical protein Vretifemale_4084 [Volvox reticuliferus]GIL99991.1 hypothetical protein Vretimale_5055 [Volvox reticuliferus]
MAASVAFLHQVEYEAALNDFEEEAKRQFGLRQDEERADADDAAKGEISSAQCAAVQQRKMQLRRKLLVRQGDAEKFDTRKSTAVASWLSAQESANNTTARAQGQRQSRDAARSFDITRSRWQDTQSEQQPQQNHRRRQSIVMMASAAIVSDVHPRHSSSITARTGVWHRILHLHAELDGMLPIYSPNSFLRRAWDLVIMALVIWTAVTVPLSVSFGMPETPEFQMAEYVITALFALDLFANFRTAYYNHQAELVRDSAAISTHYMKTWFWIDLFGTIPFDSIVLWTGALKDVHKGTSSTELAALGFLKAPRLLRLGRLLRFLDSFKNAKTFRIVQLFMAMLLISHWLACIWYMMYRFGGKDDADDWAFEVAMFETSNDSSHGSSSYHPDPHTAEASGSTLSMYVVTYYYSFLLLVGDNVTAYNNFERTFCVLVLIAGTFFYSAVVGQMATLVATMNVAVNRHGQKLLMVQDALRYADVPDKHSEKVQKYFEYLQQRSHPGSEGMQFLQELPSSLQLSLCQFLHLRSLHMVPLFKDCEQGFMNALAIRIRMISLSPGEVIFRVGDVGKEMYVIKKGCVAVTSQTNTMWGLLQPGEVFGEVALLSTGKRTANCTALGFVDLAVLTGPDLKAVMRDYPVSAAIIYARAAARATALQSKSKMWLDISADEEFYDCEEPDDDADGGDNRGDDDGGGDFARGGSRSCAAVDEDSGAITAEDGDAGSMVTSSSIRSGSLTSSSMTENLGRGSATGVASDSNICSGGGDYPDPTAIKDICMAALGCFPDGGDGAATKAIACTDSTACDDSGSSVRINAASCSDTSRSASAILRTPSLTGAAKPGAGMADGMSASLNGRALCIAWCDGANPDADAAAAPGPAGATAATTALSSRDNNTPALAPDRTAAPAETGTRRLPLSEFGQPERSIPPLPLPSDSCPTSPHPAHPFTPVMAFLPVTSERTASSAAEPQLNPSWSHVAPSPQVAGAAAAPASAAERCGSGGCFSTRSHPSLSPAQPLAAQSRIGRISPVNFAMATVASVAGGGPTSPPGPPFDASHSHLDSTSNGAAAALASASTFADLTAGTYRTATSRRRSSSDDDTMALINAVVSNTAALESGDDGVAKLNVDEAWQASHQTHRMRQRKGTVSSSGLVATGSSGAPAAMVSDVTSTRSPGRIPQHNHQPPARQPQGHPSSLFSLPTPTQQPPYERHHSLPKARNPRPVLGGKPRAASSQDVPGGTAEDRSWEDNEATPAIAATLLEPFGLSLLTFNGPIGAAAGPGTSGGDTKQASRHPTSSIAPCRDGSAGGSGSSVSVSDGAKVYNDRQLVAMKLRAVSPAAVTAASVDNLIRNVAEAAPMATNGDAAFYRSRAGPVAEAVDLPTPVTDAVPTSPGSRPTPNLFCNAPMLPGAANTTTGGSADAGSSALASAATSPLTRDAVRRRSSFLRWLQAGPAPGAAAVATASGSASTGEAVARCSANPATSASGAAVATLLQANGAAILRLSRRSSGLIPQVGGPGNVSSGGAAASVAAGGPLSPPPSAASRRMSRQSTGTITPTPAEPVQVAEEELEWISTRPSYGAWGRGPKTRRSSVCSIHEDELAALAPGPFGPRHVPSSGPMSSPPGMQAIGRRSNRNSIADCRPAEGVTPGVYRSTDNSGGMDMGTPSGAGLVSAADVAAYTGNRRGSLQLPRSTIATLHLPHGDAANAIGMGSTGSTWSGHLSRTPPPPAPPPDGVFVPRESWEKLIQAMSRLTWFETALQQLTDLVSEQDVALSRLEQRAERAAALGGAGHGAVDDGILAGILPATLLADAATSAAATAGGGSSAVATAVGGGTQTAAAVLLHSISSTSYGRPIPASSRAAIPGGGASSAGSLSRSDSHDANMQRAAVPHIRSAARALTVLNRMRSSHGVGSARVSITSMPGSQAPGTVDAPASSLALSPSPRMAALRLARASDTPDTSAGRPSFRGSVGSQHHAATVDLSGGGSWAGPGVNTWDLEALPGQDRRRSGGSASGLPSGTQARQSSSVLLSAHGSGLRAALKGVASTPPSLQESPSLLKTPSGRLSSSLRSSLTSNRRGGE